MNRKIALSASIGIIVAVIVVSTLWTPQGPINLDNDEYLLGENIFMRVRDLQADDRGNILIYTPLDVLLTTKPYDGSLESDFNFYFTPDTIKHKKICTPEELVGEWKIVFEDESYPPTYFKIIDEILPGFEKNLDVVC
ncbi:MAG: hypothetical protein K8823_123 [Cenarchaeum symbiont of Oopsacas minuta]|nr:hypothetical protein [Cenarchaeum symbiont of Oopsacas minuta]